MSNLYLVEASVYVELVPGFTGLAKLKVKVMLGLSVYMDYHYVLY